MESFSFSPSREQEGSASRTDAFQQFQWCGNATGTPMRTVRERRTHQPVSTVRERRWDDISLGWCGNTDRASIEDSAASSSREKGTPASTRFLGLGTPLDFKLLRGRGAQRDSPPRSDLEAEGKGGRPRLEKGVAGLFFALLKRSPGPGTTVPSPLVRMTESGEVHVQLRSTTACG